jgi:undecaprenyl-phosphate galactose phosphotransferase
MGKIGTRLQSEHEKVLNSADYGKLDSHSISSNSPILIVGSRMRSLRYRTVKRWIDVFFSLIMFCVFLLPGLLIGAAIALTSEGSVFYSETRIGRGGRPFLIWKFRSMTHSDEWKDVTQSNACGGPISHWRVHKRGLDPRVTPVGRFLRRWSLDELPQIFNVLRGDMSLVGPRPVVAAEIPLYGAFQDFYLVATPGLSGLWQVSGRSDLNFSTRAKLDAFYVRNWSLAGDFHILLRTIPSVLGRVGAR